MFISKRTVTIVLLMTVAVLTGCARFAPVTALPADGREAGVYYPGKIVWHDLLTADPDAARAFYETVFAWRFDEIEPGRYLLAYRGDAPVAGIARHTPRDPAISEAVWVTAMSVDDVDAAATRARELGAELLEDPADLQGWGRIALIRDPQGALLALLRAEGGDPPDSETSVGGWMWNELWSSDPRASAAFYRALAGLQVKRAPGDGVDYLLMVRDGQPRAGLVKLTLTGVEPSWLPYLRVADVDATIERVVQARGRVVIAPQVVGAHGSIAVVQDPTGGVLAIQQPPSDNTGERP